MGLVGRILKPPIYASAAGIAVFSFWTRKSNVEPLPLTDLLFESSFYHRYNPERNQMVRDTCVRFVPLRHIDPLLLENGRLVEAFSAGFWGGPGYALQAAILSLLFQCPDTAHQLWSRDDLLNSTYDVGIQVTNHFEVLEKTPGSILFRGGDSPSNSGLRSTDGLLELTVSVRPDQAVAEFNIKSVFYQGLGKATSPPMSFAEEWLHRQYVKLLMETAIRNVLQ